MRRDAPEPGIRMTARTAFVEPKRMGSRTVAGAAVFTALLQGRFYRGVNY